MIQGIVRRQTSCSVRTMPSPIFSGHRIGSALNGIVIGLFLGLLPILQSCVSTPRIRHQPNHLEFVRANVLLVKYGMSPAEVEKIFGPPDSTAATTCGSATSDPWPCLIWIHSVKLEDNSGSNSFTFSLGQDPPFLNHWNIGLVHDRMQ